MGTVGPRTRRDGTYPVTVASYLTLGLDAFLLGPRSRVSSLAPIERPPDALMPSQGSIDSMMADTSSSSTGPLMTCATTPSGVMKNCVGIANTRYARITCPEPSNAIR